MAYAKWLASACGGMVLCASTASGQQGTLVQVLVGGGAAGRGLGQAVASAGDVDGDGLDDLIAGFRYGSGSNAGTAEVFSGAGGPSLYMFTGKAAGDRFGQAVDGAGDVNADGYDDLVVGAVGEDANGLDSGAAYVYSGRDGQLLYAFAGDFARAHFGGAVSGAGDVNADGFADVVVGGQPDPNTPQPIGFARVFSGADGSVLFDFVGESSTSRLGGSVDAAGDVNGDGFADVLVGDWRDATTGNGAGSASVFSGADGSLLLRVFGDTANDRLGTVVAGVGDVDGDGRPDLLAASPWADGAVADLGLARVYSSQDGSVLHSVYGDAAFDFFGSAAAGVGDFDGDGVADFAVGAFADDDGGVNAGSVRVYSGADGSVLQRVDGDTSSDELGYSVAAAGDVSGDGGADFVVGAPNDDRGGGPGSGAALVFAGAAPANSVESYCTPGLNELGPGAAIGYLGSTSIAAGDFTLTVEGARPRSVGLFFFGADRQRVPFMKGVLCVARPRYRAGPQVHLDASGYGQLELGAARGRWAGRLLAAGSTWNFQFLYLDPPCRKHGPFNLSDAETVTFAP